MSTPFAIGAIAALAAAAELSRRGSRSKLVHAADLPVALHSDTREKLAFLLSHGGQIRHVFTDPKSLQAWWEYIDEVGNRDDFAEGELESRYVVAGKLPPEEAKQALLLFGDENEESFEVQASRMPHQGVDVERPVQLNLDPEEDTPGVGLLWEGWDRYFESIKRDLPVYYYGPLTAEEALMVRRAGFGGRF